MYVRRQERAALAPGRGVRPTVRPVRLRPCMDDEHWLTCSSVSVRGCSHSSSPIYRLGDGRSRGTDGIKARAGDKQSTPSRLPRLPGLRAGRREYLTGTKSSTFSSRWTALPAATLSAAPRSEPDD